MCGIITLLLVGLGFFGIFGISSAVVMPTEPLRPTMMAFPTPTPAALQPAPTETANAVINRCAPPDQLDADLVTLMTNGRFTQGRWALTVTEDETRSRFIYTSAVIGATVMVDLLHYDCGYTQSDIDIFLSDEAWETVFSTYDSWEYLAVCVEDNVQLHEFQAVFNGQNYAINYWIDPVTDQRVANVMIALPQQYASAMSEYASNIYPELMSCAPARTSKQNAMPTATPTPAVPSDSPEVLSICNPPQESDLQVAAAIDNNTLQSPTWVLSATGTESMTRFNWTASSLGGVAMIEVLHYDCGYTDDDVDAYFTDSVWDTMFASYESWEETAVCFVGRLRLHEFDVTFGGYHYSVRYWIDPVSEQRIASLMLVLPEWEADWMDIYAAHLYPALVSCESL